MDGRAGKRGSGMCGCAGATAVQMTMPSASTPPVAESTGVQVPASTVQGPTGSPELPETPKQSALDAKLAAMTTRMAAADGFDAKNAIFHEYFDAIPEADNETRTAFFGTFMSNIPKADADRVSAFLEGLAAKEAADKPSAPAATTSPAPAAARTAPDAVLMIGDSLSVGTKQYFTAGLTGAPTSVDATSGISLKEGMRRYDAVAVKPQVVEMALFTNNAPNQIGELRAALDTTIADARQRNGRVVWATIVGNRKYGSYDEVNAMLRDYAAKNADVMGLVDWAKMTAQHPGYLAGDGIHGTAAGYKARAQAFADAAKV